MNPRQHKSNRKLDGWMDDDAVGGFSRGSKSLKNELILALTQFTDFVGPYCWLVHK